MPLSDVEHDLEEAKRGMDEARANLVRAMRRARQSGMTYRAIASIVGLAHETVRRLINDTRS